MSDPASEQTPTPTWADQFIDSIKWPWVGAEKAPNAQPLMTAGIYFLAGFLLGR